MKKQFWTADWFVGALVVAVFAIVALSSAVLDGLERKAYDTGVKLTDRSPSDKIAIIAIDQQSLDNIGRWPWSREIHAQFLDKLVAAKPKVIASTVLFTEPQQDKGAAYIKQLLELYNQQHPPAADSDPSLPPAPPQDAIGQLLIEASTKLDVDQQLANSIGTAGNVILPMVLNIGEPQGNPDRATPPYVQLNEITPTGDPGLGTPIAANHMTAPIAMIGERAAGIGHINTLPDLADGAVRQEPLALRYYDQVYPSIALLTAARSLNIQPMQISVKLGEAIQLGSLNLHTEPNSTFFTYFYKQREGRSAIPIDSFYDVASGKIPAEKYRGKIVLIGTTVTGIGASFVTPVDSAMSSVEVVAHNVSSILQQDFFSAPAWGGKLRIALCLLIAAYIIAVLPRLRAGLGATVTGVLLASLIIAYFALMTTQLTRLDLITPAVLLAFGHLVLTTKRFLVTEKGKEQSELSAAESNRMLGLAFQGQGQLDMAFDKFRKVPMDDSMMDLLHNLASDFERKRQFNKAESVYQHMSTYNKNYKDLEQKLSRARQMSETVILGGGSTKGNSSTLVIQAGGGIEKPMLGRYQVEKELGKGAMGVVYLGKDPKIGRVVAIKTMALAQEFEGDELDDARKRFFREAETAGRLNHPNIVTIYDAGEEHDLAYIAMEFLKGKDLAPHTKPGQLLPIPEVMNIVMQVADALDYAHKQQVAHRDIKPANIMYEREGKVVKVTDFGIARITDASRTKTGMVLGTPSYMSPEQLSGKKVDGRSDLFSLGVMLYQMSVGTLPFQGESMAELMFRIANDPYTNPKEINPAIPDCLVEVIDKALKKRTESRFQTGAEFAQALKVCAATFR